MAERQVVCPAPSPLGQRPGEWGPKRRGKVLRVCHSARQVPAFRSGQKWRGQEAGCPGGGGADIGCHLLPENRGSRKPQEKGWFAPGCVPGSVTLSLTVSQETDLPLLLSESSTYLELYTVKGEGEEGTAE